MFGVEKIPSNNSIRDSSTAPIPFCSRPVSCAWSSCCWSPPCYLADDLFACQSVVKMLKDNGDDFIFTRKEASHKALYDFIGGAELQPPRQ